MDKQVPGSHRFDETDSREHIIITPAVLSDIEGEQLVSVNRVDIRFVKKEYKRSGLVAKIVREKVKPITDESYIENRVMGSETDGLDFCDDAIDKVAKANSVRLETTQILPEVSASSCAFHTKSDRSKNELLYMSNHHAGHLPQRRCRQKPVSNTSLNARRKVPKMPSDMDIKQFEKELDNYPKFPSALPGHMPSKEFVMTWLLHGSEPDHHFPEITTPRDKKIKFKTHKLGAYKNSFVSE